MVKLTSSTEPIAQFSLGETSEGKIVVQVEVAGVRQAIMAFEKNTGNGKLQANRIQIGDGKMKDIFNEDPPGKIKVS